jgi:serpin B
LENKLTSANLTQWARIFRPHVIVLLPKFKLTCEFSLQRTLAEMGMTDAFKLGKADFSGMDGSRDLFVSAVLHKAFVDVNEEGTEAAAATGVVMGRGRGDSQPPPPIMFRADHPFVFLIQEKQNGGILFMGRVTDPTK